VNVHLTPVVLKQGDRFAAVMDALSDAEAKHKVEITAVTKGLDLDKPTIVLGDFNSISSFIAPKTLADMGMVDSFTSVVANPDTHATWTWPTRPLPISLRIDYIFHTKHFSTKESEIIRREGSDHSLVVSELLLKPAEVSSTRSE
jgi:endonuclease/exonuclease/phosphatase family metal-dependent hydrolase